MLAAVFLYSAPYNEREGDTCGGISGATARTDAVLIFTGSIAFWDCFIFEPHYAGTDPTETDISCLCLHPTTDRGV